MEANITYRFAQRQDAELLIQIYNAAFYCDFLRYGHCPAYGRGKAQMEASIQRYPKAILLYEGKPVGVLSAQDRGNGMIYLGCLCVLPAYQGKGIGTQAIAKLEQLYPNWRQIELITPADKQQNLDFYIKKCGFTLAGQEKDGPVCVAKLIKRKTAE
nr:GNAT family N-acetyltransferase [bacterium]